MATLTHVSKQWANRPAPDRHYDVQDLIPILEKSQRYERSDLFPMDQMSVSAREDEIYLGLPGIPAPVRLNNWSFDRLCRQIDVDASAEKRYPAEMVVPRLEYGLRNNAGIARKSKDSRDSDDDESDDEMRALYGDAFSRKPVDTQSRQLNILMAPDELGGGLVARSIESASYGRYRDLRLAKDALVAVEHGWRTPRAMAVGDDPRNRIATEADEMKCSLIKAGMKIGPAGVYYSDRNMFIFLASDLEVLPGHFRFVTLENSEVGENRKLKATFGLMNYVCMNHILWGVSNVHSVEKKHWRGAVEQFGDEFRESLELVSKSEAIPESLYNLAKQRTLGANKDEVIKNVYSRRLPALTLGAIENAWKCAEANPNDSDGAPENSYWRFVQGVTRYSQSVRHADRRVDLDRAAGLLLDELKLEDASVSESVPLALESNGAVAVVETPKRGRKAKSN